ncbi:hypothetical protein [Kushneria aurantia]|uniref:Uncharacterized protein n=1 Tax=Kushneria aurantia TaxID=504092 RepID=A0ABV6G4K6_9GAMM|nr:hypothetical protein [Kushneria aurantia]
MAGAVERARWGVDVQTTRRNSNDWHIVHGLEAGAVISAVESLPAHLQAMARYCWGPFTRDELAVDHEVLHAALVDRLQRTRLPGQGGADFPSVAAAGAMQALCRAAIHHHSQVTWPYRRPGLKGPRAIARWLDDERGEEIDVRRWSAAGRLSWSDVWDRILLLLDDWELQALAPVAGLMPQAA